jgi:hypothetical protein
MYIKSVYLTAFMSAHFNEPALDSILIQAVAIFLKSTRMVAVPWA